MTLSPVSHDSASAVGRTKSRLVARYEPTQSGSAIVALHESGALRLRHVGGRSADAVIVNTGGGIVAGDHQYISIDAAPAAQVRVTSAAAEKIYRSDGDTATVDLHLRIGESGRIVWLPQETILFDSARLHRNIQIDLAASGRFIGAETLVFGRLARGESAITGYYDDAWHLTRAGKLVFADRATLSGALGEGLDRPAVGAGARATALLLMADPDAAAALDSLRHALAPFEADHPGLAFAASQRDGLLIARFLAREPADLRGALTLALRRLTGDPLPRSWA